MAIEISAGVATQLNLSSSAAAQQVSRALASSTSRATSPSRNLPDSLGLSLDARQNISLRTDVARRAVTNGITYGTRIIADLRQLEAQLSTAINQGLVSSRTELRLNETRVSRLNIGVAGNRALTAIDRLVDRAETGGVNLISSTQGRVTIQTTEFGGRVTVSAQPLDSAGLSIRDLSVLSSNEAIEARGRVNVAIATAQSRLESLAGLQRTLEFRAGDPQPVADFGQDSLFQQTVRGRLINLSA